VITTVVAMLAVVALMVPQQEDLILVIKVCRDADPDSWTWWLNMCWLYSSGVASAAPAVISSGLALAAAKLVRWFAGRR
jgi:hypothetical protein